MKFLIILVTLVLISCSSEKLSAPIDASPAGGSAPIEHLVPPHQNNMQGNSIAKRTTPPPLAYGKAAPPPAYAPRLPPPAAYAPTPGNLVDDILDTLSQASMAFSVPRTANVQDRFKVQLLINPSVNPEVLEGELSIDGKKSSARILISKIVTAKLTAPGFVVEKITPEEQAISQKQSTEWMWVLTPTKEGKFDVHLDISAVVRVDRMKSSRHIKTFEKDVTITVTKTQQAISIFQEYGEWIWTTILAPIGLWVWSRIRRRQKNTSKKS